MDEPLPPTEVAWESSRFAICNLLHLMPHIPVTTMSELDYAAVDPVLLAHLADAADASRLIVHIGTSSIDRLATHIAAEALHNESLADSLEALGWLVAELNAVAEVARKVSEACRQLNYDRSLDSSTAVPVVKP